MSLFTGQKGFEEFEKAYLSLNEGKRIRYKIPTYIKFYSIYQYDRLKFRKLLNKYLKTKEGENRTLETLKIKQDEILNKCYIRDEAGKPLRDSDEKHIFREGVLQRLYERIYTELDIDPFTESTFEIGAFVVHSAEKQAELKNTWQMSIKDRIKAHIKVLRKLKKENKKRARK